MAPGVFAAVLFAALLHAVWNAAVRAQEDRLTSMSGIVLGHAPIAGAVLLFAPAPAVASVPYILIGAAIHLAYQLALAKAYEHGELTQSYPIARGSAPLIVALVSVAFLGEHLDTAALIGIGMIGIGVMSLVLVRRDAGTLIGPAAAYALLTGCFTAAYSLVDGWGARTAGSPFGFFAWLTIVNAAGMLLVLGLRSPEVLRRIAARGKLRALAGSAISFTAFAIVVWAFTRAPIATVSALRESSIVFATLIGVFVLRERLDLRKLLATAMTMGGVVALRFARS